MIMQGALVHRKNAAIACEQVALCVCVCVCVQITAMSYVLYFIISVESMIAAHICRHHERKRNKQKLVDIAHQRSLSTQSGPNGGLGDVLGGANSAALLIQG